MVKGNVMQIDFIGGQTFKILSKTWENKNFLISYDS